MNVDPSNEQTYRPREGSFDMADDPKTAKNESRSEIAQMARGLRRMKRHLLLKHVEEDSKPVGSLRDLFLQVASGEIMSSPPASPRAHVVHSPSSPSTSTKDME